MKIAIYLNKIIKNKLVELRFTEFEEKILSSNIKDIAPHCDHCMRMANIWDLAGDIAMALFLSRERDLLRTNADRRIVLYFSSEKTVCDPTFYTLDALIQIFSKLKNWTLVIENQYKKGQKIMSNNKFYIECPAFGEEEYNWETPKAKRDYAHPVDSKIIGVLDNKAVNAVMKNFVEMQSDAFNGPIVSTGICVTEKTYPEINALVNECVKILGIQRPHVVISSHLPGLNACAFGSDEECYVALSPLLIKMLDRNQLKYIIGHECGHIAMGHMMYHTAVMLATQFAKAVPIVGPVLNVIGSLPLQAWSRRSEITADRAGLLCCKDGEIAKRTLLQLTMPFVDVSQLDIHEYLENSEKYREEGVLRNVSEYVASHPLIPKRIRAIDEFMKSKKYYQCVQAVAPADAMEDDVLEHRIEEIVKVL